MVVTQNLNRIIVYAQDEAERLMSPTVEAEHFLLAIFRLIECSAYDLLLRAHFRPQEAKAMNVDRDVDFDGVRRLSVSYVLRRVSVESITRMRWVQLICC